MTVELREKIISKNRKRLYLHYHPGYYNPITKRTSRIETLEWFIYSEFEYELEKYMDKNGKQQRRYVKVFGKNKNQKRIKLTPHQKAHNKNSKAYADNALALRRLEINNGTFSYPQKHKLNSNFIEYYESNINTKNTEGTTGNWESSMKHLKKFAGEFISFKDVTVPFANGYEEYLRTANYLRSKKHKLSHNAAAKYWGNFLSVTKKAFEEGYLKEDINKHLSPIIEKIPKKHFLKMDELQLLADSPLQDKGIKRGLFFSALTGLRYSDIKKMVWREIRINNGEYSFEFIQQKKNTPEYLPISKLAASLLGPKGDPDQLVFKNLNYSGNINKKIQKWVDNVGIDKKITWHSFRHSFNTNLHRLGVSPYLRSQLMTHGGNDGSSRQTARYTHLDDEELRAAVNLLELDLSSLIDNKKTVTELCETVTVN